ncbi:TPM domain-containing protein [bacterium]|nr:TPM domain-containing protein [bacterium]
MVTGGSDIPRRFFSPEERSRIAAAIGEAEMHTSGEIRLFLERDVKGESEDPYARARQVFARLKMHETAERNGVLIYLAVRSRRFAIVGDEELHKRVGEGYWTEIRDLMAGEFADGRFTEGLVAGIAAIGEKLGRHFPRRPDDINELPDDIAF